MNTRATLPIGIYDSGVGGLSIALAIQRYLPHEKLLYFSDSAHVPYGDRTNQWLIERTLSVGRYLAGYPVKALVIACNTATTNAISELRASLDLPVIGIEPAIKVAAQLSCRRKVALMATRRTVASRRVQNLIQAHAAKLNFRLQPCPGLADCVERGELNTPETTTLVSNLVRQALSNDADVLLLGCTHYHFLVPQIHLAAGPSVRIIWPEMAIVKQLARQLAGSQVQASSWANGSLTLMTTGCVATTHRVVQELVQAQTPHITAPC